MDRRKMLGTLGVAATGIIASHGVAQAQQEKGHDHHKKGDVHHKCAKACFDCAQECSEGFDHCLEQLAGGKKAYTKAAHLCRDCADVCATAGKLVAGMSPLMVHTCHACAECCDDCIAECQKLGDPRYEGGHRRSEGVRRELPRDGQGHGRGRSSREERLTAAPARDGPWAGGVLPVTTPGIGVISINNINESMSKGFYSWDQKSRARPPGGTREGSPSSWA